MGSMDSHAFPHNLQVEFLTAHAEPIRATVERAPWSLRILTPTPDDGHELARPDKPEVGEATLLAANLFSSSSFFTGEHK